MLFKLNVFKRHIEDDLPLLTSCFVTNLFSTYIYTQLFSRALKWTVVVGPTVTL